MEAIAGDNATPSPGGYDEEDDNDSIYSREEASLETQEEAPDAAYNIRIKSHRYMRDADVDEDNGAGDDVDHFPLEGKDNLDEDGHVPSRVAVKKISSRVELDAKRKEEMAARRKRLQDRMENKGKDAGADDSFGITAKLKEQKAYADKYALIRFFFCFILISFFVRLCTTKSVPTLPDGVTLRDDPMTKTQAFLKSLPKLT